jgi:hypothetical protein
MERDPHPGGQVGRRPAGRGANLGTPNELEVIPPTRRSSTSPTQVPESPTPEGPPGRVDGAGTRTEGCHVRLAVTARPVTKSPTSTSGDHNAGRRLNRPLAPSWRIKVPRPSRPRRHHNEVTTAADDAGRVPERRVVSPVRHAPGFHPPGPAARPPGPLLAAGRSRRSAGPPPGPGALPHGDGHDDQSDQDQDARPVARHTHDLQHVRCQA